MRRALALGFAALPLLFAACAADADTTPEMPRPTAPSLDPAGLPAAILRTSAGDVHGEPGTRCWARACVDMVGPITTPSPAPITPGESLAVDFEHGPPSEVTYTWMAAAAPVPTPTANGVLAWSGLFPPIAPSSSTGLTSPDAPGRYVLIASAFWHGEGDITYGFYLEVE